MKKLNIYIWGGEQYNIYHLLDYVKCHNSDDDFSFFFINKKINGLCNQKNTYVFDYPKHVNDDWVNIIYNAAKQIGVESIIVNTAIKYSESINFLLLRAFHIDIKKGLEFKLNIYEADFNDLAYRKEFNSILKKGLQCNSFIKKMKMSLVDYDGKWPAVYNYLFDGLVPAKYVYNSFFLNVNDFFLSSDNHGYANFLFDDCSTLEVDKVSNLLGVKTDSLDFIKKIASQKKCIFFVDDGKDFVLGNEDKDSLLLQEICHDRPDFVFLLNYKGAIGNQRYEDINFVKLPDEITLELLSAAGVTVDNVYGICSLSLFALGYEKVKKIFFHEDEKFEDNVKLNDFLISNHCNKIPVIFLNETINRVKKVTETKLLFLIGESMGDALFAIGSLHVIRDKQQGDIILIAPKIYHDLLRLCPFVDDVWDVGNLSTLMEEDIYIAKYIGNFYAPCSGQHIFASKHQIDSIISSYGITKVNNTKKEMVLSLDKLDKQKVDGFLSENNLNKKIVLIHPNEGVPNRTWPKTAWEELIGHFINDGWSVVLIGANTNFYSHKKAIAIDNTRVFNAIDKFSMGETVYLMSKSSLLVACDSGPVALAGATDIAICAIYSVVPGKYRLPYRHNKLGWNAQAVDLSCRYGHCAKYYPASMKGTFDDWCPNNKNYSCVNNFGVNDFYQQIRNFVNSDKYTDNLSK